MKLQFLLLLPAVFCHGIKHVHKHVHDSTLFDSKGSLNLDHLDSELAKCEVVKELNHHLEEHSHEETFIAKIFAKLFPFEAAMNSILATIYISGPPNLILSFIPASIDPSKLAMLVSFAAGGLLGDVFLHLLPQTFLGEPADDAAHFVFVDERRNIVLGVFIFIGFMFFFSIDKGLRILNSGEEDGGHGHGHGHSHGVAFENDNGHSPSSTIEVEDNTGLKNRKKGKKKEEKKDEEKKEPVKAISSSVRTAAWLNLISDFTHNITDGLAITSAFYISKNVGSTTALAVFLHEVPHEIGDFAVLIQGGFSKWQAMNSQFVTAAGAFLGCFIGIAIQSFAIESKPGFESSGLFGTTVTAGDLTLPFTAGGFLYICTVGVIPEVLELGKGSKFEEVKRAMGQLFFMLLGISLMFAISWFE